LTIISHRQDTRDAPFPLREVGFPMPTRGTGMEHPRTFVSDLRCLSIIVSVDHGWMHLSVAGETRYPDWDEIHALRDWWFPAEMEVVMVLARHSEYVNVHENCFHLWESRCGEEGR
jgi:hypothetical protein